MKTNEKRAACPRCSKPVAVCLCDAIHEIHAPLQTTIWQDPTEAKHKLSTTPLLNLSVPNSRVIVGDSFSFSDVFGDTPQEQCILLYPLENKEAVSTQQKQNFQELLILDGTWRKVRRLLHLNPWLTELPHLSLQPQELSHYRIRKSPREDGLSTIEAAVAAFSWFDQEKDYHPMLSVLEKMVQLQERHTPAQHQYERKNGERKNKP